MDEVFSAPEGAASLQRVDDPGHGLLRLVASPIRLDGSPTPVRRPPPLLGEHTDDVLGELDR
jgi:formyl-CoA transferase